MVPPVTAIIDACVLHSAPVRDLLIRLAQAGLVRARWTQAIHDEWMRSVLARNPALTRQRLERTRALMDEAVRDCLVTEYEALVESLTLPDPDDRHVLAAAIKAGADVIVTYNLADFPAGVLAPQGIEAQHPDELVAGLLESDPESVCAAIRQQRESLKNPPRSVDELLSTFEAQGMTRTVARLRSLSGLL